MVISWVAYAASFVALSLTASASILWIVTLIYGIFAGLGEGIERAVISDFADPAERGTAYGWYNMMLGLTAIPAGVLFGAVWQWYGAPYAFLLAGAVAAIAAFVLHFYLAPNLKIAARLD